MRSKMNRPGCNKGSIIVELAADPVKHEAWAKACQLRYDGAKANTAQFPVLLADSIVTDEKSDGGDTAGEWIVPFRLLKPEWGEKIEISQRYIKRPGKVEDCQLFFSPNMPPCRDVIKKTSRTTRRTVVMKDLNVGDREIALLM